MNKTPPFKGIVREIMDYWDEHCEEHMLKPTDTGCGKLSPSKGEKMRQKKDEGLKHGK